VNLIPAFLLFHPEIFSYIMSLVIERSHHTGMEQDEVVLLMVLLGDNIYEKK